MNIDDIKFSLIRDSSQGKVVHHLNLETHARIDLLPVNICETDNIAFHLRTRRSFAAVVLSIQDVAIELTNEPIGMNGFFEYSWFSTNEQPPLFLNHFGRCVITLSFLSSENEVVSELSTNVEVFATKINSVRAARMLDYLESRMEDVTRSCFSATFNTANSQVNNERTGPVLLQEISTQLEIFSVMLPRFQVSKRCRLVPRSRIVEHSSATNISESSVQWVLDHTDELIPAHVNSMTAISINNKMYDTVRVQSDLLEEDTDVYENQIIAGYLKNIAGTLAEIRGRVEILLDGLDKTDYDFQIPIGFESISGIKKKFGQKYYRRLIGRCNELQNSCNKCIKFCNDNLPVRRVLQIPPDMTSGFLSLTHYNEVFHQIVAWYRLGKLNTVGGQYLYGLKTLNKLYEFFCLYKIIEALETSGWILSKSFNRNGDNIPMFAWNIRPDSVYNFYHPGGKSIELVYEHEVFTQPHEHTDIVDIVHGTNGPNSKWVPDFTLKLQDGQNANHYIVFDAKYTSEKRAFGFYLPGLTMKYIHGIGSPLGGTSPVRAMFILFPRNVDTTPTDTVKLFHAKRYDIFSSTPAYPALGIVQITPELDVSTNKDAALRRLMQHLLV